MKIEDILNNVQFTEFHYDNYTKKYIRLGYIFLKGITNVGLTDIKNISGSFVTEKIEPEIDKISKEILKLSCFDCIEQETGKMRSGVKRHRGYFKIVDFVCN